MEGTWMESLKEKSIAANICMVMEIEDRRTPIKNFILHEQLPNDPYEARKMRRTVPRFVLIEDQLYRTMGNWPLLKYVTPEERKYILQEVHEGICRSHIGINILVKKTMRYSYYWPKMKEDAQNLVRACFKCQIHANKYASHFWTPIPFAQWV